MPIWLRYRKNTWAVLRRYLSAKSCKAASAKSLGLAVSVQKL
jgi:hypothetical protein